MRGERHFSIAVILCASLGATSPALAGLYTLDTLMTVPADIANAQPGGEFTSFDIGYVDPVTGNYFIADRSNASVDIFSGSSLTFLGRATGFTGQQATTSTSGADGVLAVTTGGTTTLFAGDGNSTLKVFNATSPAAPSLLQSISTGGKFRVDEMAYSPTTHQVLAANNADAPAFATLFSTTNGGAPVSIAHTNITIPGQPAGGGIEQPVWNPGTGTFFVSVPQLTSDPAGGLVEIKTDGTVGRIFDFSTMGITNCSPTGLAVGASGNLLVGCGLGGAILFNPAANGGFGAVVKIFTQIIENDEIWFDPTTGDFFITGKDGSSSRVFDVISDVTDLILQSVLLPVSALSNPHSIAVDPLNGDVFVPLAGSTPTAPDATCPLGCIAVYAQAVPEPGSLPIMATGLILLLGLGVHRRWHDRG